VYTEVPESRGLK